MHRIGSKPSVQVPGRILLRYAVGDLVRNKGVNAALVAVLVLSALLMATGAMVIERLAGSVGTLFEVAKPPHFLQMHKGGYDRAALERFAAAHPEIDSWLVEEMLGYDGAAVAWERPGTGESGDLGASSVDNLFVTQNDGFDLLVGTRDDLPEPAPGEVYVPVRYQLSEGLRAGDVLRLRTGEGTYRLSVAGAVKDAQMASSFASASRFLISGQDFRALRDAGGNAPEIIAEYRLADAGGADALQSAYESDPALPRNGPAITYQQIQVVHTLSDGLAAVALILISLLLIVIALLSLRFVIKGTLQDEVRQIGAMKAIGLPDRVISGLYLARYGVMTLVACAVGGVLAIFATNALTRNLRASYAEAPAGAWTVLVPVLALAVVFLVVVAICRRVLGGVRRIEVVGALVHGSTLDERRTARRRTRGVRRDALASASDLNRRLAFVDLRAEAGQWALVPVVFLLATLLVALPANLLSTFESPSFVTYTGVPERDLLVEVQYQEDVAGVARHVRAALEQDERLTGVEAFGNVLYRAAGPEGPGTLPVDVGDWSTTTVRYTEGGAPGPGQVALSLLNAAEYRLGVGDDLTLDLAGATRTVEVSGLYQDVTAGGKTAKMQGDVPRDAAAYTFYADVADGATPEAVAAALSERFPTAVVVSAREVQRETLSFLTDSVRGAAWLALAFGVGVSVLVTSLFLKLRLARDRSKLGVLSAVGFSADELVGQVRTKTLLLVVTGIALGLVGTATAGERLVSGVLSVVGISDLSLVPDPWIAYVLYPLLLLGAGYLGVVLLTAGIQRADKSTWLRG